MVLVLIDAVSVFLGVAAMRLAWRVIMATYSGWFAFRMEPVGYVKMFVFVLIGYLLVLGLDFRRIRKIPMEQALKNVLTAGNAEDVLRMCGKQLASQIKAYARDLKDPPKEKITIAASGGGKTNPLFQTGAMINGITYRIRSVAE